MYELNKAGYSFAVLKTDAKLAKSIFCPTSYEIIDENQEEQLYRSIG